jgi:hypothetical protein
MSLFKEVNATGNQSVSLTPAAGIQTATWAVAGLPPLTAGMKNYVRNFWQTATITFDPDAAGNAVRMDQLWKGCAALRLHTEWLGEVQPFNMTRGAVVGNIISVIHNGYQITQPARIEIPASTDSDVTLVLYFPSPFECELFKKPQELAPWQGFFNGGTLEFQLAASNVFDGDYAGAVTKAPVTIQAFSEYFPSPDHALHVPFQWRERVITGGGSFILLKAVGQESQLVGVQQGAGLVCMFWMTDAPGVGLAGPEGVDAITSVEIPWRGQLLTQNIDGFWLCLRRAAQHRVGPVSGLGTTIIHDGAGWPTTMADTPNGRFSASANQMFLPIIAPGLDFETSKAQRVNGDLPITINFSGAVSGAHRVLTMELLEWNDDQRARLAAGMGCAGWEQRRKGLGPDADDNQLRYTRWHCIPPG